MHKLTCQDMLPKLALLVLISCWLASKGATACVVFNPHLFTSLICLLARVPVQVWDDALVDGCQPDCRMATTLIEVCTRKGDTSRALATYQLMQEAALGSNMAPSVHAYTAAMRAAAEGGAWEKALDIWSDMEQRNCKPTGRYTGCCCFIVLAVLLCMVLLITYTVAVVLPYKVEANNSLHELA